MVWRFSNKFSNCFRCRKLALTRETSYIFELILGIFGRHVGVVRHLGMSACQSVYGETFTNHAHTSIHPLYISMSPMHPGDIGGPSVHLSDISVCQYIHWSISLSIACHQLYNCRPVMPGDQHHC